MHNVRLRTPFVTWKISNKQNYKAINNNNLKKFEQNTIFHCNRTPKCLHALNREKAHLNFDLELNKKQILSFIVGAICVNNTEACLLANGKSNQTKIMQNLIFLFYQNVM